MSQERKITDTDLSAIRELQNKFQSTIEQLGIIGVERMALDDKEKSLKEEWKNLQRLEQELMDKILKTYGEGSLNINTGVLTPTA